MGKWCDKVFRMALTWIGLLWYYGFCVQLKIRYAWLYMFHICAIGPSLFIVRTSKYWHWCLQTDNLKLFIILWYLQFVGVAVFIQVKANLSLEYLQFAFETVFIFNSKLFIWSHCTMHIGSQCLSEMQFYVQYCVCVLGICVFTTKHLQGRVSCLRWMVWFQPLNWSE